MRNLWPALFLTACATQSSSSILTSGMSATMSATANGDGSTNINVSLFAGDPVQLVFIDLGPDDHLVASHAGVNNTLGKVQLLNIIDYGTTFATDNEGDEFTIDFLRKVDAGAPMSVATLPAKFTLDALPSTQSRAQTMSVTYSPGGTADLMSWDASGDCINDAHGDAIPDTGTIVIGAGTLAKKMVQGQQIPDSCAVTLKVTRTQPGILDSHFGHGGSVAGNQVRTGTFTSTL